MQLSSYDFTIKHRAGRVHNNADGLSRARAALAPDTPPADVIATESAHHDQNYDLLVEALEYLEEDANLDGDEPYICTATL